MYGKRATDLCSNLLHISKASFQTNIEISAQSAILKNVKNSTQRALIFPSVAGSKNIAGVLHFHVRETQKIKTFMFHIEKTVLPRVCEFLKLAETRNV